MTFQVSRCPSEDCSLIASSRSVGRAPPSARLARMARSHRPLMLARKRMNRCQFIAGPTPVSSTSPPVSPISLPLRVMSPLAPLPHHSTGR